MRPSILALAVASLALSLSAKASTTYSYSAAHYATATSPYTTSEHIYGSFTVPTALTGFPNQSVTPTSYDFFDGVDEFTQANSTSSFYAGQVDAQGNLGTYNVTLTMSSGLYINLYSGFQGQGYNNVGNGSTNYAVTATTTLFTPSTSAAAVTPEPSSFLLLGTGVLGVLGAARRRFSA